MHPEVQRREGTVALHGFGDHLVDGRSVDRVVGGLLVQITEPERADAELTSATVARARRERHGGLMLWRSGDVGEPSVLPRCRAVHLRAEKQHLVFVRLEGLKCRTEVEARRGPSRPEGVLIHPVGRVAEHDEFRTLGRRLGAGLAFEKLETRKEQGGPSDEPYEIASANVSMGRQFHRAIPSARRIRNASLCTMETASCFRSPVGAKLWPSVWIEQASSGA